MKQKKYKVLIFDRWYNVRTACHDFGGRNPIVDEFDTYRESLRLKDRLCGTFSIIRVLNRNIRRWIEFKARPITHALGSIYFEEKGE